jgi:hypothetical protein
MRPDTAVWELTHLHLRFVALLTFPSRALQINYFYGRRGGAGNPESLAPGFDYVLVTESRGHLAHSGLLFDKPVTGGPWRLRTNLRQPRLVLQIQSTRGKAVELRIAAALLGREANGVELVTCGPCVGTATSARRICCLSSTAGWRA